MKEMPCSEVSRYVLTVYGSVRREVWLAYLAKRG